MSLGDKLIRRALSELVPYESARRIGGTGEVWLNANENPDSADYSLSCARLNRYPEFQPAGVINGYAAYAGVTAEQLITTRGADEAIELLIRTFCEPGQDAILICPPTYGMYKISAETNATTCKQVVLDDQFQPDVDAIKAASADVKLVFLCSPNNPTGHDLESSRLLELLTFFSGKALVVVDEAYIEFSTQPSMLPLMAEYENLVILRTLSKAFGLAGIRCGFVLAQATIIEQLLKVIPPYPVPDPVAQIATQALSHEGIAKVKTQVKRLNQLKQQLFEALQHLPSVEPMPSAGNFILIRVPDANACMQACAARGIVLRNQSKQLLLENTVRITVGNAAEMAATLDALTQFYKDAA